MKICVVVNLVKWSILPQSMILLVVVVVGVCGGLYTKRCIYVRTITIWKLAVEASLENLPNNE